MVRSKLREHVFKMLFQIEFNDAEDMFERLRNYFELLEDAADKDREYIQAKYEAVAARVPEIDSMLNEIAKGWKTSRMSKVDLTVLRLAVYERIFLRASPSMRRWSLLNDSEERTVPPL